MSYCYCYQHGAVTTAGLRQRPVMALVLPDIARVAPQLDTMKLPLKTSGGESERLTRTEPALIDTRLKHGLDWTATTLGLQPFTNRVVCYY